MESIECLNEDAYKKMKEMSAVDPQVETIPKCSILSTSFMDSLVI